MNDKILKTDPMFAVLNAVDNEINRLDHLRLSGSAYSAKEPFYSNVNKQINLLQEGKRQIGLIFEKQYE